MTVRVVTLPEGEDPDTFVAKHGRDAMEKLLAASMDVFDRKVQLLERGGWFADLQRKRRALDSLLPTIRATTDEITRDLYVNRVSAAAGIDREVLLRELRAAPAQRGRVHRVRVRARRARMTFGTPRRDARRIRRRVRTGRTGATSRDRRASSRSFE